MKSEKWRCAPLAHGVIWGDSLFNFRFAGKKADFWLFILHFVLFTYFVGCAPSAARGLDFHFSLFIFHLFSGGYYGRGTGNGEG